MKLFICVLVICTACQLWATTPVKVPAKYYDTLVAYCNQYGVSLYYASRLIEYESGWDAYHVNKNTNGTVDRGIMQLNSAGMLDLQRWHNGGVPFDPMDWAENMRIGVMHMRYLYNKTGSWWSAIACYNMGYAGWVSWSEGKRSLPASTKKELDYVFQ